MRGGAHCVAIALAGAVAIYPRPWAARGAGSAAGRAGGGGGSRVKTVCVRGWSSRCRDGASAHLPSGPTGGRTVPPTPGQSSLELYIGDSSVYVLINSRNAVHKLYCTVPNRGVKALIGMGQSCCAMDAGLELSTPLVSRSLQGGIRTAPLQNGTARRSHPNIPGLLSCSIAVPAQSLPPSVGYPL